MNHETADVPRGTKKGFASCLSVGRCKEAFFRTDTHRAAGLTGHPSPSFDGMMRQTGTIVKVFLKVSAFLGVLSGRFCIVLANAFGIRHNFFSGFRCFLGARYAVLQYD
ncbi:MAG: hypothetical protein R6U50_16165 [Desulfobacterales bacterium]